jgi:hypothetical protein
MVFFQCYVEMINIQNSLWTFLQNFLYFFLWFNLSLFTKHKSIFFFFVHIFFNNKFNLPFFFFFFLVCNFFFFFIIDHHSSYIQSKFSIYIHRFNFTFKNVHDLASVLLLYIEKKKESVFFKHINIHTIK